MRKKFAKWTITAMTLAFMAACTEPPLVYDKEFTGNEYPVPEMPTLENLPQIDYLPDPFMWADGSGRSEKFSDWSRHRSEIIHRLYHYELGQKPEVDRKDMTAELIGDTLKAKVNINGNELLITSVIHYPEGEGPFPLIIGIGMPTGSLPPHIFEDRNVARMSFNFWQVMSHTQKRGSEPINRIYPELQEMGAYSAWPWGISRLIDALEIVGEKARIDMKHIGVTGCSFAGKMALFAGAFDERIALTIAQETGGGGMCAWRVSETLGHVETLGRTNFAWFLESMKQFEVENVNRLPIDHHEAAALIAPRALLVVGNPDWEWLAEESSYVSCRAARKVWETFGIADRMGFTIVGGHPHCMVPESQHEDIGAFVDKFLLGKKEVDTNITKAEMYKDVDYMKWMPWAK